MDASQATLAHGCAFVAVKAYLKMSVIAGRWERPKRGQRQPLFGCRRQRDKMFS